MDKKLNELAKKIAGRQIEVPTATYTSCIDKFYVEIISILHDDRTIKSLFLALNENGFNIKYQWLSKALKKLEKTNIDIKKPDIIIIDEQNILVPTENSQSIEPPKEVPNTELSVAHEDGTIKKHLSMKEKAALRITALGVNTEDTNPLLKNRLKDKK
jgi:hypothetical protein